MKKVIIKTVRNFALCIIGMICSLIVMLDFAYYYDTLFFAISLVPIVLLIRFMDDYMRDTIIIFRNDETLLASLLTALIFIICLAGAYLIFIYLMGQNDILEAILNFIGKFIDVSSAKNALGI